MVLLPPFQKVGQHKEQLQTLKSPLRYENIFKICSKRYSREIRKQSQRHCRRVSK